MAHDPLHPDNAPDELLLAKSPTLMDRWRRAFGRAAPGGASSTPSPTQGRTSGVSAPGVAEEAQRQGAQDQEAGAEGGSDPDTLHAVQRATLRPASAADTAESVGGEPAVKSVQPAIRRFTGTKRDERVGPLRFTADQLALLRDATAQHGYKGESGFAADIVLAFVTGRFTANLPLSEDRRRTHIFRAQALRQLNRIGVNVNQIARALNSDHTPPDIRQRLTELQQLLELIAEALRQPADSETEAAA
ncbi:MULTISPECIES: MobC family plasmid mobilization relaxosome protein [unclassified Streptomyces]|uniref:MobC family plasmid mobilization relaxosome protein n=1 Tax=unclassified Streptomyces TaxID=2593676 RepID=UPI002366545A|nr:MULTISPECIES: MobC family plasmid mobilization relaxosome protein [unclassified Streptomyces]MDF3140329.1 MobC family plasmid mobilization relaxosome protein [Streptomyces sp. T21Q-yed]WDF39400.1 MobC family plasmid mobilization relaxosome protein [Streptomyces sp. T12]